MKNGKRGSAEGGGRGRGRGRCSQEQGRGVVRVMVGAGEGEDGSGARAVARLAVWLERGQHRKARATGARVVVVAKMGLGAAAGGGENGCGAGEVVGYLPGEPCFPTLHQASQSACTRLAPPSRGRRRSQASQTSPRRSQWGCSIGTGIWPVSPTVARPERGSKHR